jgi:hypothetical protein
MPDVVDSAGAFVPSTATPCVSCPSSFTKDVVHASRCFGLLRRCWYSIKTPVSGSIMALAQCTSVGIVGVSRQFASFWMVIT